MANHQATKKDVRQSTKRRERNRYYGKTTRNAIRDIKELKGKDATEKMPDVISQIDKHIESGEDPWSAVISATEHRLRPILLTAAAAILGPP